MRSNTYTNIENHAQERVNLMDNVSAMMAGRNRWNYPSTCAFEVKDVVLDSTVQVTGLRIGDWDYYKLNVNSEHANDRYLLVDMVSSEIHADPILLLRKGEVPRLRQV